MRTASGVKKPSLPVALALAALGLVGAPRPAWAQPQTPAGRPRAASLRPAPPALSAAPVVMVQLAGLRPGEGRSWAATMHALRRDALPWLEVCATALGPPRTMVRVELVHRAGARWGVGTVEASRRHTALEDCVRRAAERVVVPASEQVEAEPGAEPTPEAPVSFDVAFGMPRFGPAPRR